MKLACRVRCQSAELSVQVVELGVQGAELGVQDVELGVLDVRDKSCAGARVLAAVTLSSRRMSVLVEVARYWLGQTQEW